jgi:hypothetical protein
MESRRRTRRHSTSKSVSRLVVFPLSLSRFHRKEFTRKMVTKIHNTSFNEPRRLLSARHTANESLQCELRQRGAVSNKEEKTPHADGNIYL